MHSVLWQTLVAANVRPQPPGDGGPNLGFLGWLCPVMLLLGVGIGLAAWYGQRKAKERVSTLESSLVDVVASRRVQGRAEEPLLPPDQVVERVRHAEEQLTALAQQDTLADPAYLREWSKEVFLLVQRCWAARNHGPAQAVMGWGLYGQHLGLLKSLRDHHEMKRIEDLELERLELVDAVTTGPALSCTALITFRARSYYVDDLTQAFRRGNRELSRFQEFWTFQRQGDVWLVHTIEKSKGR